MVLQIRTGDRRQPSTQRPTPSNHRHLDEMVVVIRGRRFWLWRAVDNEGEVLDVLVQPKRDAKVAIKLMKKLLKRQGMAPSEIVTDKLRLYRTAFRKLGLAARHDRGLRATNRAESSHRPVRRRDRKMQPFKSPGSAQRFLSVHTTTYNTSLLPALSPETTNVQAAESSVVREVVRRDQICLNDPLLKTGRGHSQLR
jgi:transposase-like protein